MGSGSRCGGTLLSQGGRRNRGRRRGSRESHRSEDWATAAARAGGQCAGRAAGPRMPRGAGDLRGLGEEGSVRFMMCLRGARTTPCLSRRVYKSRSNCFLERDEG